MPSFLQPFGGNVPARNQYLGSLQPSLSSPKLPSGPLAKPTLVGPTLNQSTTGATAPTATPSPAKSQYINNVASTYSAPASSPYNATASAPPTANAGSAPPPGTANGYTQPSTPASSATNAYSDAFNQYIASLQPSDSETQATKYLNSLITGGQEQDQAIEDHPGQTTDFFNAEKQRADASNAIQINSATNAVNAFNTQRTANSNIAQARADYEKSLLPSGNGFSLSPGQTQYDSSGNVIATSPNSAAPKIIGSASSGYYTVDSTGNLTPLGVGGGGSGGGGVLSPTEAQALGVPYGTTQSQAYGITPEKPLTQSQGQDYTYATRATDANQYIGSLTDKVTSMNPLVYSGESALENTTLGNTFVSSDIQSIKQAERNFVTAILRRESGAAISPSEFTVAEKQYFPQPGDSAATVAQKAQTRQAAINSFTKSAGKGAFPNGLPSPTAIPGGSGTTDADYQSYLAAIGQ